MNLSTAEPVEVSCQCGRLFDFYIAVIAPRGSDGKRRFIFHRVGQEGKDWMRGPGRLKPRGGRVTGRHREHRVIGRDDEAALRFECGCGIRPRTISLSDLARKLERASERRIWL